MDHNFNEIEGEKNQRLASGFLYALIFNGFTFGLEYYWVYRNWVCSFFLFSASLAGILLELVKLKIPSTRIFSNLLTFLVFYALFGLAVTSGGTQSVAVWWFGILPLMASILLDFKSALFWSGIAFFAVVLVRVIDAFQLSPVNLDSADLKSVDYFINQIGLVFTITIFGIISERLRSRYMLERQKMQEKAFFNKNLISLGEMAAGLAHEISNPLTIIKGNARSIKKELRHDDRRDEKLLSHVEKVETMIERTTKIVDSLRVLSRDGSLDKSAVFSVGDALDDVLALVRDRLKTENIHFDLEANEIVQGEKISGMQIQLAQVLVNLINNAIDAVSELEEQWIKVKIFSDDEHIFFRVIDSGPGIPEKLAEQIFTPFFTTKEVGKGTGLGLSLCHQILKKMQGDISLCREVDNTCFEVKVKKVSV